MQVERVANRSGQLRLFRFANLFGLIRHPKRGICLFDTGYSRHFLSCTNHFPELIYRTLVPVSFTSEESAVEQLRSLKIEPEVGMRFMFVSIFKLLICLVFLVTFISGCEVHIY